MELADGETLTERLLKGPLPVSSALTLGMEIASAPGAAHRAGIVLRDLKPANVKVTEEAKVKLLDFGLAKALEEDSSGTGNGRRGSAGWIWAPGNGRFGWSWPMIPSG